MGLNKSQNQEGKIFLNIVNGKITRRYKNHQKDGNGKQVTVEREIVNKKTKKVDKVVIEQYWDDIDGTLVSATIDTTGDYGANLVFEMNDDGENFLLQIPLDSSYGDTILKRIPNIATALRVKFVPYNFESKTELGNDGNPKKIIGCNVFQEGVKIKPKWTKEEPGNLPKWIKSETTGKWNNTDYLEFLGKYFLQWAAKINNIITPKSATEKLMEEDSLSMETEFAKRKADGVDLNSSGLEEDSDLPF